MMMMIKELLVFDWMGNDGVSLCKINEVRAEYLYYYYNDGPESPFHAWDTVWM